MLWRADPAQLCVFCNILLLCLRFFSRLSCRRLSVFLVATAWVAIVLVISVDHCAQTNLYENLKLMNRACALSLEFASTGHRFLSLELSNFGLLYIRAFGSLSVHWMAENGQARFTVWKASFAFEQHAILNLSGCSVLLQSANREWPGVHAGALRLRVQTKSADWEHSRRAQPKSTTGEHKLRAQPETVEHTMSCACILTEIIQFLRSLSTSQHIGSA